MSHTPTPWKFVPWHIAEGPSEVRAPAGWLICCTSSDGNAEHIVKAVNAHNDLVAALKLVMQRCGPNAPDRQVAEAALAKAGAL